MKGNTMISKDDFIKRLDEILEMEEMDAEFEKALRKFAPSDFTGFSRSNLIAKKIESLEEDVEDSYGYVCWWLYEADRGQAEDSLCTIEDEDNKWIIKTAEDLYDYLQETNREEESTEDDIEDFIQEGLARRAQVDGVRFAINVITQLRHTNKKTNGVKASEIEALLKYVSDKIETEYALSTGIFIKLYENEGITLFSNDTE